MAADAEQDALETGYAPTTPPGDNLEIEFVRDLAHSYRLHAQHAGHATAVDDDLGVAMADNASPSLFLNSAVLLRPLAADDAMQFALRTNAFFGEREGGSFAVWSAWPTPDLRPFGFHLAGHPPLMLREPGGNRPTPPSELEVTRVSSRETADAYEIALVDGFPVTDLQPWQTGCFFAGDALNAPGWHHYVGFVDGQPVATASAYAGDNVSRVDNVATIGQYRGHGYGAALTWAATLAAPDLPATLLASDDGRPIYERMGYRSLLRATLWIAPRGG